MKNGKLFKRTAGHGLLANALGFMNSWILKCNCITEITVTNWAITLYFQIVGQFTHHYSWYIFQIIMAKQAGGPKPPPQKKDWDDDDQNEWTISSTYCTVN